jgi:hypothetical protein
MQQENFTTKLLCRISLLQFRKYLHTLDPFYTANLPRPKNARVDRWPENAYPPNESSKPTPNLFPPKITLVAHAHER